MYQALAVNIGNELHDMAYASNTWLLMTSQLRRCQFLLVDGGVWYMFSGYPFSVIPDNNLSRFPGAIPCFPRNEQSHHPSRPLASCSRTDKTSPRLKASSSGVSATLSYKAFASNVWKRNSKYYALHLKYVHLLLWSNFLQFYIKPLLAISLISCILH